MYVRRGIANQVYIPPVDYDNNIKELKSPRRQLPRQYSDPPPYHENGTNGSVDSNYMQQQGANIFETNSSYCSYDSLKNEEGSYSYIPFPDKESRRFLKPDTRKVTHRYVIIVAIVLVALAILAAIAATALTITDNRVGSNTEEACILKHCPINGNWSDWENWSGCSTTCGGGTRNRTRHCDNPTPQHNGQDCVGVNSETSSCGEETCSPIWGPWGEWSGCSLTCGNGLRSRNRTCNGFCESRSANCSYHHPTRCDMYITCDAGKNMHEHVCNVLLWYKMRDTNPCLGDCDYETNVECTP